MGGREGQEIPLMKLRPQEQAKISQMKTWGPAVQAQGKALGNQGAWKAGQQTGVEGLESWACHRKAHGLGGQGLHGSAMRSQRTVLRGNEMIHPMCF